MIAVIGQWSHIVAALLFAALAIWQLAKRDRRRSMIALGVAFALTAIWAGIAAALGSDAVIARAGETVRNLGFLTFMYFLLLRGQRDESRRFAGLIYLALFVFGALQAVSDLLFGLLFPISPVLEIVYGATAIMQMSFAIGALLLVNALYTAAAPEARWGIRLSMIALAAMWAYDLNLYTFAWLTGDAPVELLSLRGILMIGLVPSFALSLRRDAEWKMKLSRKVTFRSLSLIAIGGYFLLMFLASEAIDIFASDYAAIIQVALVFLMSIGAVVLLPSPRVRSWLKVKLAKHFFEHRYDYRAEWIRFNKTLARPGKKAEPLDQRVIRAIAEITEAPGGLLLTPNAEGRLAVSAQWNWRTVDAPPVAADAPLVEWLTVSAHIVELSQLRAGRFNRGEKVATLIPAWMIDEPRAWALVPLIHQRKLAGAVLIEQPRVDRTLDWEDLDLLRIAGRQAASYLAEARGQDALAEARRFDEFNRRFAFIMHDLKNLVSQLSLVARNAERHADNPEFRADMIATLQDSVGKMNDLLVRLAPRDRAKAEAPRPCDLAAVVRTVAAQKSALHEIDVAAEPGCVALADPVRLETALTHLVQNAIDATADGAPIRIAVVNKGAEATVMVEDRGQGMDAAFIRDELFRPFNSSKTDGFGIGAFEARALIGEMGGRLDVESESGKGSCFTISLPLAEAPANPNPELERMTA